jgi:hypothetical protein
VARNRAIWAASALAVVAGVVVLATPLRDDLSDLVAQDDSSPTRTSTPVLPVAATGRLPDEARRAAVATALGYRRLAEFAGARRPRVARVGPWTTEDGAELIGAEVTLALARPRTVDTVWPTVAFDGPRAYRVRNQRFRAAGVRHLIVLVDVRRHVVVSIGPDPRARVTLPPGAKPTPPAGGED